MFIQKQRGILSSKFLWFGLLPATGAFELWSVRAGFIHRPLEVACVTLLGLAVMRLVLPKRKTDRRRVAILGSGARASVAWRELRTRYHGSVEFLGFIDDRCADEMAPDVAHRLLTSVAGLPAYVLKHVIDEIIVAAPVRSCYDMVERTVALAETSGIQVSHLCDVFPRLGSARQDAGQNLFTALTSEPQGRGWHSGLKRFIDFAGSAGMILLLAPVMTAVAVGVKLTSPGPVFYVQRRIGMRRRAFPMVKFRSMVVDAEQQLASLESQNQAAGPLFKLQADPRTTAFGRFLRKSSLDELPQLFNVFLGQMSLVGPRPVSFRDADRIEDTMMLRRFSVKPGMTGMWQVRGRSSVSLHQWVALDAEYIDQWSVKLDLEILALTLPAVLRRSGAA